MSNSLFRDSGSNGGYSASDTSQSRSPLSSIPFLSKFTGDKKTRDGQAPKRRGPKPDSKPALTRRQELNRQAQRTHRERKEMYIKALEQEVLRLKEVFTNTVKERDAVVEENRKLKELLAANGINVSGLTPTNVHRGSDQYGGSSSGSFSGSYAPASSSGGLSPAPQIQDRLSPAYAGRGNQPVTQHSLAQIPNTGLDYDQIGVDFVLTLERPCMDHMQILMVRSDESLKAPSSALDYDQEDSHVHISGHALMATCPPESHVINHPEQQYPHQMPDIGMPDLMKLLDLSSRLPLEGEITPIIAWTIVMSSPRIADLTKQDLETVRDDLAGKIRCYGFGAVLEEFEVHDALMKVLASKPV